MNNNNFIYTAPNACEKKKTSLCSALQIIGVKLKVKECENNVNEPLLKRNVKITLILTIGQ